MSNDTEATRLRRQFATYILVHGKLLYDGLDAEVQDMIMEFDSNKVGICKLCCQLSPLKTETVKARRRGGYSGICVWNCDKDADPCEYMYSMSGAPRTGCRQPAEHYIRWRGVTMAICQSHALAVPRAEAEILTRDDYLVAHVLAV